MAAVRFGGEIEVASVAAGVGALELHDGRVEVRGRLRVARRVVRRRVVAVREADLGWLRSKLFKSGWCIVFVGVIGSAQLNPEREREQEGCVCRDAIHD